MKFVVDMNLPPSWCDHLRREGHEASHWSEVGDPKATDLQIMAWAQANAAVIFTHDLDFGALLAAAGTQGPSVIQVRSEDVMPEAIGPLVTMAIRQYASILQDGALIVVEPWRVRTRVLPLRQSGEPPTV